MLQGAYLTGWKQVGHEHFSEPVDSLTVLPKHIRSGPVNFQCAIDVEGTEATQSPVHLLSTWWRLWDP